jgi:hypothetical protein
LLLAKSPYTQQQPSGLRGQLFFDISSRYWLQNGCVNPPQAEQTKLKFLVRLLKLRPWLLSLFDNVLYHKNCNLVMVRNPSCQHPAPTFFLKVVCLLERTSSNPFDCNISITFRCDSGRSFAMQNPFRNFNWNIS